MVKTIILRESKEMFTTGKEEIQMIAQTFPVNCEIGDHIKVNIVSSQQFHIVEEVVGDGSIDIVFPS